MKQFDMAILITARNEVFLRNTIEDLIKHCKGNTQIIVGLDGKWSNPPLVDHPMVTIFYVPESIGQRAMLNQLARLAKAKWLCKLDAHCVVGEGFDIKMLDGVEDNWTVVPTMYNLHAFSWKCMKCGKLTYQGPIPTKCEDCDNTKDFKQKLVWKPRWNRKTESWIFDKDLHFQYTSEFKKRDWFKGDFVETMSLIGACFMLTKEKWFELNICDEKHGSWGQQGTEISAKTWLSGGKLIVNRKTFFAHLFRTQKDFGFPYPQSNTQVNHARDYSKDMWYNNKFDKQIYPLSWMLDHFAPIPGWDERSVAEQKEREKTTWHNLNNKKN